MFEYQLSSGQIGFNTDFKLFVFDTQGVRIRTVVILKKF
jgi:hypothetical protein